MLRAPLEMLGPKDSCSFEGLRERLACLRERLSRALRPRCHEECVARCSASAHFYSGLITIDEELCPCLALKMVRLWTATARRSSTQNQSPAQKGQLILRTDVV